jgi:hypothetical protein
MKNQGGGSYRAAAFNPQPMETTMNRILEVTDENETLALEFVDLDDLRNEGILPQNPSHFADQ